MSKSKQSSKIVVKLREIMDDLGRTKLQKFRNRADCHNPKRQTTLEILTLFHDIVKTLSGDDVENLFVAYYNVKDPSYKMLRNIANKSGFVLKQKSPNFSYKDSTTSSTTTNSKTNSSKITDKTSNNPTSQVPVFLSKSQLQPTLDIGSPPPLIVETNEVSNPPPLVLTPSLVVPPRPNIPNQPPPLLVSNPWPTPPLLNMNESVNIHSVSALLSHEGSINLQNNKSNRYMQHLPHQNQFQLSVQPVTNLNVPSTDLPPCKRRRLLKELAHYHDQRGKQNDKSKKRSVRGLNILANACESTRKQNHCQK